MRSVCQIGVKSHHVWSLTTTSQVKTPPFNAWFAEVIITRGYLFPKNNIHLPTIDFQGETNGCFQKYGFFLQNGGFIMENPMKIHDLRVPLLLETPKSSEIREVLRRLTIYEFLPPWGAVTPHHGRELFPRSAAAGFQPAGDSGGANGVQQEVMRWWMGGGHLEGVPQPDP